MKPVGEEWVKGRLFYESSSSFIADKEYLIKWRTFTLRNVNTAEELVLNRVEFKIFKQHNKIGGGLKTQETWV